MIKSLFKVWKLWEVKQSINYQPKPFTRELRSPCGGTCYRRWDGTFHSHIPNIHILLNTWVLRWNTHSTSFCTETSCKCICASGQRRERPWRIQGFGSLRFVWLGRFLLGFRVCLSSRHRYSFRCRSFPGRNTHSRAWDSQFWCTCSLGHDACVQIQ